GQPVCISAKAERALLLTKTAHLLEFARQIGYAHPLAFSLAPRLRLKSTLSGMIPSCRQRRLLRRRRRRRRPRYRAQQFRRRDRGFRVCKRYYLEKRLQAISFRGARD